MTDPVADVGAPATRRDDPEAAWAKMRLATEADGPALASLMADVPMEGDLVVATRRDPDFFALYRMQRGVAEAWVHDDEDGRVDGMGAFLARGGFLAGRATMVGYLGDLRSRMSVRRMRALPLVYGRLFAGFSQRHGVEAFLTGVLASNRAAMNALVARKPKRASQPRYHALRAFDAVSVHLLHRRRVRVSGLTVRTARADDVPTIASFLAADHARRPFGWRFDDGELQHRLAAWPGFTLDATYLAHDDGGRLRGVVTAWDPSPVKRYRALRYGGALRVAKPVFDATARALGWTPLPDAGQDFRYFYLTNQSILDDDPVVLRALLARVYADFRGRGYGFFMLPMYEGDPLAPALRGFPARRLAFRLYAVTQGDAPPPLDGRPGFEIALA